MLRIEHPESYTIWALDTACYAALGIAAFIVWIGCNPMPEVLNGQFLRIPPAIMAKARIDSQVALARDIAANSQLGTKKVGLKKLPRKHYHEFENKIKKAAVKRAASGMRQRNRTNDLKKAGLL